MTMQDEIKALLQSRRIAPNRALGQNFLADETALKAIADAAKLSNLPALEIGPGLGGLTKELVRRAPRVIAVEKDAMLAALLPELVPDENLTVITGDILKTDIGSVMQHAPFDAVGNLPYYITTPIAEKLLCLRPKSITVLVQREAAERFTATPRQRVYGPLSVLANVYYLPKIVMDVPRSSFYPQPNVDSALVRLSPRADAPRAAAAGFFRFLNRVFAMRRKTLVNNLRGEKDAQALLSTLSIALDARAEQLSPAELFTLYEAAESARQEEPSA